MTDFADKRIRMVQKHLKERGITDQNVLDAFRSVPRERFVPEDLRNLAYADRPLPIGHKATISQPYIVALMCQKLELKSLDRVLDIGTGSGYEAAILAKIVKEVVTIERIPELATEAEKRLENLGYNNVEVVVGDGSKGYPKRAPYNGIKVAAATNDIPDPWINQLADGGTIIFPRRNGIAQELIEVKKIGNKYKTKSHGGVRFVPLIRQK